MLVTVLCDHRVIDGYLASQALAQLLRVIESTIAQELTALQRPSA
jgi:pyruvate/2-oxoglutarate dehydrogenase complex dihydrolipoamide acyltransferase (E2) component